MSSVCERFPTLTSRNSILLQAAKPFAARMNSPKSNNRAEDSRVFEESGRNKNYLLT